MIRKTKYKYHPDGYLVFEDCPHLKKIGKRAGTTDKLGYRRVRYEGKLHLEHRVIWKMLKGYWPKELDHINRIRDDNRIENLREVTHQQNRRNNGSDGVYQYNKLGKNPGWMVYFSGYYEGGFATREEALAVAKKKKKELWGI